MGRPAGLKLNRFALDDILRARQLSLTEAADACGIPLTSLSALRLGDRGASMRTVRQLAEGLNCSAETLFPALLTSGAAA